MSDPRNSPSIFTRGAVDLGALRRPAAPPAAAASAAPPAGGAAVAVVDVTEATFQGEVLERSLTTPVVVDFWASWCEPCKQLSPLLEKLAAEAGGAWVLAKVDVDANPRLAQLFRIQGIPMVIGIVGGQPVDAFSGVVPEAQLRQWVDALLKAGGVEVVAAEDPRLDEADEALMTGDLDAAEAAYQKILHETPGDVAAQSGLAQVTLTRRVRHVDPAAAVAAADAAPADVAAQLTAADVEVLSGLAERAYDRLVALVRRTAGEERDTVRDHLVSLFAVAGPDDPAVAAARRALASALF
ncbi:co-chaperone YbbN [Pilimelia terevasa]|uniref:Co-chaperone YbbN n=1 Tax=Pilimelia terevasa TaxID=53372 RepID=A0A8J3FFR7_9ACTN|nr:tetratricopeptide repeat protein [Pilimelia terevasa]GGK19233.1 co-chaperone YbbN [Pilimelia terevasa]